MTALRDTRDGRKLGARTREDVIEALRRYERLHGTSTSASFNPATAKWTDRQDLIDIYYGSTGPWPSLNSIRHLFGTFNAAREAAGLPVNRPGPGMRRKTGEHAPIRTVREHLVHVPSERTRQVAAQLHRVQERLIRADERISVLRERAEAAERALAVERRRPVERVAVEIPARVEVVTRTKVERVKVRDERALERLRAKLEDVEAVRCALADQLKATVRDRDLAVASLTDARSEASLAIAEASRAVSERDRASDRLAAVERRVASLMAELEVERERNLSAVEAVQVSVLVRAAEVRVEQAETRVARAEREMVEQAQAITGERRRLTTDELVELRSDGPAGPTVLAVALKRLGRARSHAAHELPSALTEIASAALSWRDRLG